MTLKIDYLNTFVGKKYNGLTVLRYHGRIDGRHYFACICGCGRESIVQKDNLKVIKSCGCANKRNNTHGLTYTSEYRAWQDMKHRCYNLNDSCYKDYGDRGITVWDRWLNSFENFYEDMGPKPSPELSLDRRNNDGNYAPENCRWATDKQQANNKRNNIPKYYDHNDNGFVFDEL